MLKIIKKQHNEQTKYDAVLVHLCNIQLVAAFFSEFTLYDTLWATFLQNA
jgi:hypothetical protein